jgi:hypothetical protein
MRPVSPIALSLLFLTPFLPDSQIEARDVLRRANETSKIVPTPLTRTEFVDGPDSQQAAPIVRSDDSSEIE